MERPNPSRETKFSGANGDREVFIFPCLADHEQDWQPYPVDLYSGICEDHTYMQSIPRTAPGPNCDPPPHTGAPLRSPTGHALCCAPLPHTLGV